LMKAEAFFRGHLLLVCHRIICIHAAENF